MPRAEKVQTELISADQATQIRVAFDDEAINHYADLMARGVKLPPAKLFYDKNENLYFIGDGWHRYYAAEKRGEETLKAEVEPGTQRDALRHALQANQEHGVRRTRADKRNAVNLALQDADWSKLTSRRLAALCGVSASLVDTIRKEQTPDHEAIEAGDSVAFKGNTKKDSKNSGKTKSKTKKGENQAEPEPAKRTGKDGREYNATKPKRQPKSGKEKIKPAERKKAKDAYGVLTRFARTAGISNEAKPILRQLGEIYKAHWGAGR